MIPSVTVVKGIDRFGRVNIPAKLRLMMRISEGDYLQFYVDDEKIVLKKHLPGCFFCNNAEGLKNFKGKMVCRACLEELKEIGI